MKLPVYNMDGQKTDELSFPEVIAAEEPRTDLMHRVVRWQLARRRAGTASAKTRSEVSGTTKKPFRQKGTGNARQGSMRGPHMRTGGVAFGPKPRDHGFSLPKKVRAKALRGAIALRQKQDAVYIIEAAELPQPSVKSVSHFLKNFDVKSALFVAGDVVDVNFAYSVRNLPYIHALPQQGLNVYSILSSDALFITRDALSHLEARLS